MFFSSCEEEPNKIVGVWYTIENYRDMPYYFEAHLTDTSIIVVNQDKLSYVASYFVKSDTLKQYVKSMHWPFQVIDTINFRLKISKDSLSLVNFSNPEKFSSWKKIDKVEPSDFLSNTSENELLNQFRDRFIYNYLNKTTNLNKEILLKNFNDNWNLEN